MGRPARRSDQSASARAGPSSGEWHEMVPWPAPTMVTRTSDACHPRSGALSIAPLSCCVEVRCAPSPTDSSLQCDGSGSAPPASSGACNESAIALDACDPWTPSIPLLGNGCAEGAICAFLAVPFRPHQSCTRSKGCGVPHVSSGTRFRCS